jgi:acetyl esterase/lipase
VISRLKNLLRRGVRQLALNLRPAYYSVITDIDYLPPPSTGKADLYLPKNRSEKRLPAIVVIHGGGWVEGDKQNPRELSNADLANQGFVVLAINYTLFRKGDPSTLWPRNLHDCKSAVRWLRKNAATYRIAPDHIGALGESAGGQLAALLALTAPEDGLDPEGPYGEFSCRVQAAVDLYGPSDFRQRDKPLAMLGELPTEAPELYAQASPASYGHKSDPPLLIIHGTADDTVPVRHSQDLAAALTLAGAPHELVLVPNGSHAFDLRPKEMDLRPVVFAFFDKYLLPTLETVDPEDSEP